MLKKSAKRNSLASSSLAWLQARAQKLIEQVVTGTAKQAYVATVFAVYYTEAYDREDIKRSHVKAGMVHHDGRDGPDFMAALHTTRAELTQSYLDMVMHVRSDFLRKSSRIGQTLEVEMTACKDLPPQFNNDGKGFEEDTAPDGTVLLRPHRGPAAVHQQRALYMDAPERLQEQLLQEQQLRDKAISKLEKAYKYVENELAAAGRIADAVKNHADATVMDILGSRDCLADDLRAFIHVHSSSKQKRDPAVNKLPKLDVTQAKAGERCLILAAYDCINKPVQLRLPSKDLAPPPPPVLATVLHAEATPLRTVHARSTKPRALLTNPAWVDTIRTRLILNDAAYDFVATDAVLDAADAVHAVGVFVRRLELQVDRRTSDVNHWVYRFVAANAGIVLAIMAVQGQLTGDVVVTGPNGCLLRRDESLFLRLS